MRFQMDIYVVQPGDTIYSIADKYGVTAEGLFQDNELTNPSNLVVGQTIVIVYPKQIYTVQEGDTLINIAAVNGITVMQLLRNNPFLSNRAFIYPGETLTISYDTKGSLITNGFAYAYIGKETMKKTLPNLSYLTVYNFRISTDGEIITYYEDGEMIQLAKEYGTIPLMMATTLSLQGEPNIELTYKILLDEALQERIINGILEIMKDKGFLGINFLFNFMDEANQALYNNFTVKAANRINGEGFLLFITFNLNNIDTSKISVSKIDYKQISQLANGITFVQIIWGSNSGPPSPLSNISDLRTYIDYAVTTALPEKMILGSSVISYDWKLPYIPGSTVANSLTIDSVLVIAHDTNSEIQFDDVSMTPYFNYIRTGFAEPEQHIVWSIDARSINGLVQIISDYKLAGIGIWNAMIYYAQFWLVLRSQYDITKLLPEY